MKTILKIVIVVLALGAIVWIARPTSQKNNASLPTKSGGVLSVTENNKYDFGTISMAAGDVTHPFKIKNTSREAVTIEKIYTSCMCTSAALVKNGEKFGPYGMAGHGFIPSVNQAIGPGEEATVEVTFDPAAHGPAGIGTIQRVVTIENNAGEPLQLDFTANVTP